jgi:hypothetical protein
MRFHDFHCTFLVSCSAILSSTKNKVDTVISMCRHVMFWVSESPFLVPDRLILIADQLSLMTSDIPCLF